MPCIGGNTGTTGRDGADSTQWSKRKAQARWQLSFGRRWQCATWNKMKWQVVCCLNEMPPKHTQGYALCNRTMSRGPAKACHTIDNSDNKSYCRNQPTLLTLTQSGQLYYNNESSNDCLEKGMRGCPIKMTQPIWHGKNQWVMQGTSNNSGEKLWCIQDWSCLDSCNRDSILSTPALSANVHHEQNQQQFEPLGYWICWRPNQNKPNTHTCCPLWQNNLRMGAKSVHTDYCTTDHVLHKSQKQVKIMTNQAKNTASLHWLIVLCKCTMHTLGPSY